MPEHIKQQYIRIAWEEYCSHRTREGMETAEDRERHAFHTGAAMLYALLLTKMKREHDGRITEEDLHFVDDIESELEEFTGAMIDEWVGR